MHRLCGRQAQGQVAFLKKGRFFGAALGGPKGGITRVAHAHTECQHKRGRRSRGPPPPPALSFLACLRISRRVWPELLFLLCSEPEKHDARCAATPSPTQPH